MRAHVGEEDVGFELVEFSSPSEAVLSYYELEGRKEAGDDLFSLAPEEHQRFEALPLIGTAKGQRTLVFADERVSLYKERAPRHRTLRVEEDTPLTEARRMLTRIVDKS